MRSVDAHAVGRSPGTIWYIVGCMPILVGCAPPPPVDQLFEKRQLAKPSHYGKQRAKPSPYPATMSLSSATSVTGQNSMPSSTVNTTRANLLLSDQQMKDLRQIFDWLDMSGDGLISANELLVALSATSNSATMEQAERLIREHGNGSNLDWLQFVRVIEVGMQAGNTNAAQMFELLDTKGTGQLGPDVLRAALIKRGCAASFHDLDKMIRYIDADGDGQVSLSEVCERRSDSDSLSLSLSL